MRAAARVMDWGCRIAAASLSFVQARLAQRTPRFGPTCGGHWTLRRFESHSTVERTKKPVRLILTMKAPSLPIGLIALVIDAAILFGCAPSAAPSVSGTPTSPAPVVRTVIISAGTVTSFPTPAPAATVPFPLEVSATTLKYKLIDQFGNIFFCDRDFFPVAHEVSAQEIAQRVAELQNSRDEYLTILMHLGLDGVSDLSAEQNRLIDAERKRLDAIRLDVTPQGFKFSLRTSEPGERGFVIEGLIARDGTTTVTKKQPTITTCPICLTGSTLIATPSGAIPVQDLRKGMLVWTSSRSGARMLAVIQETVQRPVPADVSLVHLVLEDGRELFVSAGHPSFDGRPIGEVRVGDMLDGARVVRADLEPFADGATYDILPSGETGAYWANGILLRSTLAH